MSASRIASWDGASWSALGSGMNHWVYELTTLPNGDLVAGGSFTTAGGVSANYIARWDGSIWAPLGSFPSVNYSIDVFALTTLSSGGLIAGGYSGSYYLTAGGVAAFNIALWDGSTWAPLGTGMHGTVQALATLPNGDLIAGRNFTTATFVPVSNITLWDGSTWAPLGTGMNGTVRALATLPNGDPVAGGNFTTAGGNNAKRIARWDGSDWSPLGPGLGLSGSPKWDEFVAALTLLPNGDLVAGGEFEGGVSHVQRWNGSTWASMGGPIYQAVHALATLPNGDLVAGGDFTAVGGVHMYHIARWDGSAWKSLGAGMNSNVCSLTVLPNGDLVAGGDFTLAVGSVIVTANHIARWNGSDWSALGSGMGGYTSRASSPIL